MNEEYAHNDATVTDYNDFAAGIFSANAKFAAMRVGYQTSAQDIAQVIYHAATDGTEQLHYTVGHDIPPFIKARREISDQDYIEFMKS